MEVQDTSKHGESSAGSQALHAGVFITHPNFSLPVKSIAELLADPDFPQSALAQNVDVGGYTGVIVKIVKHSIRVRSAEGATMSYNVNTLRKLYGPRTAPEPEQAAQTVPETPASPPAPRRDIIANPNFNVPVKPIEQFVDRPDFPKCAWGEFLDLHGYTGVVVEIASHSHKVSLKVRSREGATRSYNAETLRKLYGNQTQRPA